VGALFLGAIDYLMVSSVLARFTAFAKINLLLVGE